MTTEKRELLNGVNSGIIRIRGAYAAWCSANGLNYYVMLVFYSLIYDKLRTQKEICDAYRIPKQSLNNVITTLHREGYLELVPGEKNRREKILMLTEKGQAYAEEKMSSLKDMEEESIRLMGEEDMKTMIRLSARYSEILEDLMERERKKQNDAGK